MGPEKEDGFWNGEILLEFEIEAEVLVCRSYLGLLPWACLDDSIVVLPVLVQVSGLLEYRLASQPDVCHIQRFFFV